MTMYWLCATCQPLCQEEGIQVLLMDTALTLRSSCSSGEVRLRTGNISRIICATPVPQKVPGTYGLMDSSQLTCKGGSFLLHFADGTIQGEGWDLPGIPEGVTDRLGIPPQSWSSAYHRLVALEHARHSLDSGRISSSQVYFMKFLVTTMTCVHQLGSP